MRKKLRPAVPKYLVIGQISAAYGVRGEVKVEVMTDFPDRFARQKQVYLGDPAGLMQIERWRPHNKQIVLKLAGIDDRDTAQKLKGHYLQVPVEEAMPLGQDEYYVYQIQGLEVWTTMGEHLGQIVEVLFTGSNEVYVVKNEAGREVLIPAIADVVQAVDLEGGRMIIEPLAGLLE